MNTSLTVRNSLALCIVTAAFSVLLSMIGQNSALDTTMAYLTDRAEARSTITIAEGKQNAFAIYSKDDKSFSLYKRSSAPNVGDVFENKHVTAIWEVSENTNDTPAWMNSSLKANVKNVVVADSIEPLCCDHWFSDFTSCTRFDLTRLTMSNCTSTRSMFFNCSSLQALDVSHFDMPNVTDMSSMFSNCVNLQTLDISGFDTSKVTDMSNMFNRCSLQSLDLSNFNTSNVANMSNMFINCFDLKSLNLSSFDTSNVTNMSDMFGHCRSLQELDVSHFDTSNVTNMKNLFYNCSALQSLDLSNFNTSKVTDMSSMFHVNSSLRSLDLSGFDTQNVTNMSDMFYSCTALQVLNISSFNTSRVSNMTYMFFNCAALQALDLSSFDTLKMTKMPQMFERMKLLEQLKLGEKWTVPLSDANLANPLPDHISGADGNWYNGTTGAAYSNVEDMPVGIEVTYVAIPPANAVTADESDEEAAEEDGIAGENELDDAETGDGLCASDDVRDSESFDTSGETALDATDEGGSGPVDPEGSPNAGSEVSEDTLLDESASSVASPAIDLFELV